MSDLGQQRRLSRFVDAQSGRSVVIALSHGMLMGRVPGLAGVKERRALVADAIATGVTGLILSPGQMRECRDEIAGPDSPGIWLTSGWTNLWRSPEASAVTHDYATGTYRNVIDPRLANQIGADGCHVYLLIGADDPETEAADVERVATFINAAHAEGLPVLVEAMARGPRIKGEERTEGHVAMAARMAVELGADILKLEYPGSPDALRSIVNDVGVPVLVLGGSARPFEEVAAEAANVVRAGAQGIVYGRNVFQAPDPHQALTTLVQVVTGATK